MRLLTWTAGNFSITHWSDPSITAIVSGLVDDSGVFGVDYGPIRPIEWAGAGWFLTRLACGKRIGVFPKRTAAMGCAAELARACPVTLMNGVGHPPEEAAYLAIRGRYDGVGSRRAGDG